MKTNRIRGNTLFLTMCLSTVIIVPLLYLLCKYAPEAVFAGRTKNAVEAAAKLAAREISRIVIDDPEFGYISLSNHEQIGKATRAPDGEPLPVLGINTLIGTLRKNAIIAENLRSPAMQSLVDNDVAALSGTVKTLEDTLDCALSGGCHRHTLTDINGEHVRIKENVEQFLSEHLPPDMRLESVKLSRGWLDGPCATTVIAPHPLKGGDEYQAFMPYPVGTNMFSFAGIDNQVHLVSPQQFREDDGKHICSIIKLECKIISKTEPDIPVYYTAYSQPASAPDSAIKGAMLLRFNGYPVPGLLSWREFLSTSNFNDHKITHYDVVAGDFPYEPKSHLRPSAEATQSSTARQFSEELYYWLRNCHLQPSIASIMSMLDEPFEQTPRQAYIYTVKGNGAICRQTIGADKCPRPVVADGQQMVMADSRVRSGHSAIILFRNNVHTLASKVSKHGGQPLAEYPISGTPGIPDYQELASKFSQRKSNGQGLALDIEIGGTSATTAIADMESARRRGATRKI